MLKSISLIALLFSFVTVAAEYPSHWWEPADRSSAPSWEILPQDASEGEVVLSKRNELGIFSNLGSARFSYNDEEFASVEGLWQMMKYPDPADAEDPRHELPYPYTRDQVRMMSMWESKEAGDLANELMQEHGITFVSYRGKRFDYKDMGEGSAYHYELIFGASVAKVMQNPAIRSLLLSTRGLKLVPDHNIRSTRPQSYFYNKIMMRIRDELLQPSDF